MKRRTLFALTGALLGIPRAKAAPVRKPFVTALKMHEHEIHVAAHLEALTPCNFVMKKIPAADYDDQLDTMEPFDAKYKFLCKERLKKSTGT